MPIGSTTPTRGRRFLLPPALVAGLMMLAAVPTDLRASRLDWPSWPIQIPTLLSPPVSIHRRYVLVANFISGETDAVALQYFRNRFGAIANESLRFRDSADIRLDERCPDGFPDCDTIAIEETGAAAGELTYKLAIFQNSDIPSRIHGRFPPDGWPCPKPRGATQLDRCRGDAVVKFVRVLDTHHQVHLRSGQ